jgi:hypothetical protein
VYLWPGQLPLLGLTIEAKLDVMMTRLTDGALFLIDFRTPVVPITAGSRSCWNTVSILNNDCITIIQGASHHSETGSMH